MAEETLGKRLKGARTALGLSLVEVALETNIQTTRLAALEADDYVGMMSPVYVKGFVRTYARLLNLDPEPLVEEYLAVIKKAEEGSD